VDIVGVGFSGPDSTSTWVAQEEFQYDVWTDDDARTLALHYGAADSAGALYPSRITMLLDREGDLMLKYTVDVRVGTHPDRVLEDCIRLFEEDE
jgi:peroxiredoxin